jgi:hypothetical protein
MSRQAPGRVRAALAAVVLLIACASGARAQAARAPELSVADYVDWLTNARSEVEDGTRLPALIRSVPPAWSVQASAGAFDVSNQWLLRDLRALAGRPDAALRARVRDRLAALAREAAAYREPPVDRAAARDRLGRILEGREYRGIHGPTWRDRLRQQIFQIIQRLLEGVVGVSSIPTISTVLVYLLMTIAAFVLAVWTYRTLSDTAAIESVVPGRVPISARAWPLWLADARKAAARGDWREAVHLGYWCGVSYLEARGAWRPDRARTPREYLRLLSPSSRDRPALAALTRDFELVWYGTDPASARTFDDVLSHLEALGCRAA